jgi:hypothetical protein
VPPTHNSKASELVCSLYQLVRVRNFAGGKRIEAENRLESAV